MLAFTTVIALAATAVHGLTVNTPSSYVQCQPVALSWSEGTGPYYLAILPGGQPSATPLEQLPQQSGNSYTWTVNLPAGTSITLSVTDSTGTVNYASQRDILTSSDASCLGTSPPTTDAAGTTTAAGVTTTNGAAPVTSGTGPAGTTTTAAARPSSSTTGGASGLAISSAMLAIVGAGFAFLA